MQEYRYLLDIALILLMTKAFGLFSRRLRMPSVVGALIAGIVLGPAVLNIVEPSKLIESLSEIGVIVLMFAAGLETSITDLKKAGLKAFIIATLGVLVPLAVGYVVGGFYNVGPDAWLHNLGIICLTLVTGMADSSVNIGVVMFKILLFFVFAVVVGLILHKVFSWWFEHDSCGGLQRYSIVSFAFALIMAFCSEAFFGVADITGSFVAGLILSGTRQCDYVTKRISTLSYMLITPVFFASIGLKLSPITWNAKLIELVIVLCVVAVLTKIIGCGLGAIVCKYTPTQAIRIGCGMISRGEVALIVANKGMALGILPEVFVTPVLLCVVFTTVITPILLKIVYKKKPNDADFVQTANC